MLWSCDRHHVQTIDASIPKIRRDHLFAEIGRLAETVEPQRLLDDGFKRLSEAIRSGGKGASLLDLMSSPEQKAILERVTAVMSLLEGHADVVMDGVGPEVIPTVGAIRRRFDERRQGVGTLDRILRKLLGFDAKMAQYRDGARFVRAIVDKVGMSEFNAIWAAPENLPSKAEIDDPDAWIARVLQG